MILERSIRNDGGSARGTVAVPIRPLSYACGRKDLIARYSGLRPGHILCGWTCEVNLQHSSEAYPVKGTSLLGKFMALEVSIFISRQVFPPQFPSCFSLSLIAHNRAEHQDMVRMRVSKSST